MRSMLAPVRVGDTIFQHEGTNLFRGEDGERITRWDTIDDEPAGDSENGLDPDFLAGGAAEITAQPFGVADGLVKAVPAALVVRKLNGFTIVEARASVFAVLAFSEQTGDWGKVLRLSRRR
ncbi:MAG: hypothetical protein PCFJNLEI_03459 [Verrucomicrobiae bacterium]|nr:hypothetical protein [Verrucomicrobiae bacterium]